MKRPMLESAEVRCARRMPLHALILLPILTLTVLPSPASSQDKFILGVSSGLDFLPQDVSRLEGSEFGFNASAGVFVSPQWDLGAGFGLKRGVRHFVGVGEVPVPPPEPYTDLLTFSAHGRYWFSDRSNGVRGAFLTFRSGVLRHNSGSRLSWGVPVGTDLGVAIPIADRVHLVTQGMAELMFFDLRAGSDDFGVRLGLRAGLGVTF